MRLYHHIPGRGVDFRATDAQVTALARRCATWLDDDAMHRMRLGLHELLVNIRTHAYRGSGGPIDLLISADDETFRIDVTDWGDWFEGVISKELPEFPATSGYGLPILMFGFDLVGHRRLSGRNWWSLAVSRTPENDGGEVE
jgi:anti-sigma regulatory factor (Ser/Thr protein kinase)